MRALAICFGRSNLELLNSVLYPLHHAKGPSLQSSRKSTESQFDPSSIATSYASRGMMPKYMRALAMLNEVCVNVCVRVYM